MNPFQFHFPTHVRNKLLVVTDQGLMASGVMDSFFASLTESEIGYEVFAGVEPNPTTDVLERAVAFLKQHDCDSVIGVGGGSSIDTAKGVAAMATNPGNILDYEGYDKLLHPPLPIFAIPTTSGTGSECTASTVFTNTKTLFKTVIISPALFPKLAILDAELTLKLPPSITAATGMDALTHAIESYVSKQANPISQALALHAIKMICTHLPKAFFAGVDLHAREQMLLASFLAGVAFAQSKLGNVHAISHTFGGVFNIPHGIANATLLPYVIEYLPACPELFRDIAIAMGEDVSGQSPAGAGHKVVEHVMALNKAIGIPDNIKDLGVDLEYMAQMVSDSMRSANVLVNPRLTTAADVERIIGNAFHGIHS